MRQLLGKTTEEHADDTAMDIATAFQFVERSKEQVVQDVWESVGKAMDAMTLEEFADYLITVGNNIKTTYLHNQ